jgi:hypothetical protein
VIPQLPPEPNTPVKRRIAHAMAFGGEPVGTDTTYSYRLERGFPFARAGNPVTVASQFKSLGLNAGTAVGLHVPVNQNALTNGQLDPSKSGFIQVGSNVPTFITMPFTLNGTSNTTLTISWPDTPIRRGSKTTIPFFSSDTAIPAGSILITGLTAATQYFFYPFWSEKAKILGWGGAGNATSAGAPAIAQTVQSDLVLQQQSFQGFVPLNTLAYTTGVKTVTGGYSAAGVPDTATGGGRSYRIL